MPAERIASTTTISRMKTHPSSKSKSSHSPPPPLPPDIFGTATTGSGSPQLPPAPPPPNDDAPELQLPPMLLLPPLPALLNEKSSGVEPRLQKASPKSPTSSALRLRSCRAQRPR